MARLLALLVALVLLALGLLSVVLPRLVNTPEFRAALHEGVTEALGTPVEWGSLDAGVLPLRLTIQAPVIVADEAQREEARLSADAIDLRLSALALLQRRVQVDSLVLSGVELVVTRTPDGFVLPIASAETPAEIEAGGARGEGEAEGARGSGAQDGDATTGGEDPATAGEAALELAVRRFVIRDGRVVVRDRTLPRPLDWSFEGLALEARGDSLEEPLALEIETRLAANGEDVGGLGAGGEVALAGSYDLELELDAVRLSALQPYVEDATLDGLASGKVGIEGASGVVSRFESDLVVEQMDVRTFGLDLDGRLELVSSQTLDQPIDFDARLDLGPRGRVRIDGQLSLEGALEAEIEVEELDLTPYAALGGREMEVAGRATGRVELATSSAGSIERLRTDLDVAGARYADAALRLGGDLDLVLALEGLDPEDPIQFDVGMDFEQGGGRVDAEGSATLAGAVDAKLAFGNVDLAQLAPWVPEGTRLAGRLTGDADLAMGADRVVKRAKARLAVAEARVVSDPLDVSGRFDLKVDLEGKGPIAIDSTLALSDGSRIVIGGTSTVEGRVDLNAEMERFDLAIVRPFLPDPETKLAGLATGKARLVGEVASPEFVSVDLGIEGAVLETADYAVRGPLIAVVKLKEPTTRPRGVVELDLSAAELRYAEAFAKPPGMRAEIVTRFVPEGRGETVFESRLALRDIDEALVQGTLGEKTSVAVTTTNFDLEGWGDLLPAIAPYAPDGVIAVEGLGVELVEGRPARFGGRILMRGVGLRVPEAGEIRLRGAILGEESRIRTKGLRALIGGVTVGIEGAIEDPMGAGAFDLAIRTQGDAETNDLLSALTSTRDTVYGPLRFDGRVTGRLGEAVGVTESLAGQVRFTVGDPGGGRLRGISLLRTVLDQIPLLGGAARLTQPFRGGKSVDDYFTDRFDLIEGDFAIGEGRVIAKELRLAYPGYEARLEGPIRLRDLQLDMTGELLLKDDLVSALGGLAGADVEDREPIAIPLARVTQTLDDPKVTMTAETLAAVPKLIFQATGLDTLTIGIGKGVGRALDRVIKGK
jgi:hypothetical protein